LKILKFFCKNKSIYLIFKGVISLSHQPIKNPLVQIHNLQIVEKQILSQMVNQCPICVHPERKKIEDAIRSGVLKTDIASIFNVDVNDVIEHMRHMDESQVEKRGRKSKKRESEDHSRKQKTKSEKHSSLLEAAEKGFDLPSIKKRDLIMASALKLAARLDTLLENPEPTKAYNDQIVSLANELRQHMRILAEIEGDIKEEYHITINKYYELRQLLITYLCPECRKRIIEVLEND